MKQRTADLFIRSHRGVRFGIAKTTDTGSGLEICFRGMDLAGPLLLFALGPASVAAFVYFTGNSKADVQFALFGLAGALLFLLAGIYAYAAYSTVELDFDRQLFTVKRHRLHRVFTHSCRLDSLVIAKSKIQRAVNKPYKYSGLLLAADSALPMLYACNLGDGFADEAAAALHPKMQPFLTGETYNTCIVYP